MSKEQQRIYNWKRFWIPYGTKESYYSFDYPSNYEDQNKTLEELREERCLILLGDAALGKSICLKQEAELL